ncbi:hypothetical protein M6D81_29765 [Paenibacillus sp. J5C_2022]|uniref:hypothetical protein n=1 Tax=Paenibacillus sp. J5C2022 TaxID=2977129 RepID=UPI0021D164FB|nr:hypothetical protein [Paenibacillus sp. J5C2022]MCU6712897.1 hypothetical protein [Paenibacillus sp. J5C2022]
MYRKMLMISAMLGLLVLQGCTELARSGEENKENVRMSVQEVSPPGVNGPNTDVDGNSRQCIESEKAAIIYRICVDQDVYKEGESVPVTGELEYTGDKKSVMIAHAASPFHYYVRDTSDTYGFVFVMNQPLIHTNLKQGQPISEVYSGVQAYAEGGEDNLIGLPTEVPLPAGIYEISGEASFDMKRRVEDEKGKAVTIKSAGKLMITVEK